MIPREKRKGSTGKKRFGETEASSAEEQLAEG